MGRLALSSCTTSWWPFIEAKSHAVCPSFVVKSTSAPDWISARTTSRYPPAAAMCNGATPVFVAWFLLAPASTSTRTVSRCPSAAAIHKGDIQSSFALSFEAPTSTSQRTISTWPSSDAEYSGVSPYFLAWSLLAPAATRKRTMSRWPSWAASRNGVVPPTVHWCLPTPASTRKQTTSKLPSWTATCKVWTPCGWQDPCWPQLQPGTWQCQYGLPELQDAKASAHGGLSYADPCWIRLQSGNGQCSDALAELQNAMRCSLPELLLPLTADLGWPQTQQERRQPQGGHEMLQGEVVSSHSSSPDPWWPQLQLECGQCQNGLSRQQNAKASIHLSLSLSHVCLHLPQAIAAKVRHVHSQPRDLARFGQRHLSREDSVADATVFPEQLHRCPLMQTQAVDLALYQVAKNPKSPAEPWQRPMQRPKHIWDLSAIWAFKQLLPKSRDAKLTRQALLHGLRRLSFELVWIKECQLPRRRRSTPPWLQY